jgi:hypothetical protein
MGGAGAGRKPTKRVHNILLSNGKIIACIVRQGGLIVGLRYPLQMLPVLIWEVIWKTLWLVLVPLPQWMAGRLDQSLGPTIFAICLVGSCISPFLGVTCTCITSRRAPSVGNASEPRSPHRPACLRRIRSEPLSSS